MIARGILIAALSMTSSLGWAQGRFPSRAVDLVIAFPPGGLSDMAGRVFAEEMSKVLKTPIVPTNRGGASGVLGATVALKSSRDGYTWLVNTLSGMILGPTILKDAAFEADRDFLPVALILTVPDSLIVKADSPYKTINQLIEAARKNPGKLSYSSPGTGTEGHFNGEIFASSANIVIKHVPFRGGAELASAVMGGHVDFGIGAATSFISLERGGRLRTLAITGKSRPKTLPNAPTFEETGLRGSFIDNWAGCFVPAGTPKPIMDTLIDAAAKVVKSPTFSARIEKIGGSAQYLPPADFLLMIKKDKSTAAQIAAKLGMLQKPK